VHFACAANATEYNIRIKILKPWADEKQIICAGDTTPCAFVMEKPNHPAINVIADLKPSQIQLYFLQGGKPILLNTPQKDSVFLTFKTTPNVKKTIQGWLPKTIDKSFRNNLVFKITPQKPIVMSVDITRNN
jgi:hypothetical protein